MRKIIEKFNEHQEYILGSIILFLINILIFVWAFKEPRFISEFPSFYIWNTNKLFDGLLDAYNPVFQSDWYRPTGFYLFFRALAPIIGWDNIWGWQLSAIMMNSLIGILGGILATLLLGRSVILFITTGLLISSHAVFTIYVVDLIHFDGLYICITLLGLIIFYKGWENGQPSWFFIVIIIFLNIVGLTSKEQFIVFPALICALHIYLKIKKQWPVSSIYNIKNLILYIVIWSCTIGLTVIRSQYRHKGGDYGNFGSIEFALNNLLVGPSWLFSLFIGESYNYVGFSEAHRDIVSFITGGLLIYLFITGIYKLIKKPKNNYVYHTLLALCVLSMVLPILIGGRPWHYGLSAVFLMITISGFLVNYSPINKNWISLGLFYVIIIINGISCVLDDYSFRGSMHRIGSEAYLRPPVSADKISLDTTVIYPVHNNPWAFGAGCLFQFIYQKPGLKEIMIDDFQDITREQAKELLDIQNLFLFTYSHDRTPGWLDDTKEFKQYLQNLVSENQAYSTTYDFSSTGNAKYLKLKGWSLSEKYGTWSDGTISYVELPYTSIHGAKGITIRFRPYISAKNPTMTLRFYVEGEYLGKLNLNWPEDLKDIEHTIVHSFKASLENSLTLEIQNDHAVSPSTLESSTDSRQLGIYLYKIIILR